MDRRTFLGLAVGAVGLAACAGGDGDSGSEATAGGDSGDPAGSCGPDAPTASGDTSGARAAGFTASPFGLGIASGDPLHDRVILWTRLVVDPIDISATPVDDVDVVWELYADEAMTDKLQEGLVTATADLAHSVHVDVDGLEPDTVYWYRFVVGDFVSATGRTRTLPCDDARPDGWRLGLAVCQRYSDGFYAAHRDLAEQQVDLVVFLGDYIYESGGSTVRPHDDGGEPTTLDPYRNRYGLYKTDPDLQASHASAPWVAIWDDHEVENNYAGDVDSSGKGGEAWLARRAAAYRAWYEHMPVRMEAPTGADLSIHHHVQLGDLAQLLLLDGRQYRDFQPCDGAIGPPCSDFDGSGAFLGEDQQDWLDQRLQAADTRWVLLASPVVMAPMDFGGAFLNPDQWDGYPDARQRVLDALAAHGSGDAVVFSGDIHAAGVCVLPQDPLDLTTPAVATEFVVPAATSAVPEELELIGPLLDMQEHISWWDFASKGWLLVELERDRMVARFRIADDVSQADSPVRETRTWQVERGTPGAVELID